MRSSAHYSVSPTDAVLRLCASCAARSQPKQTQASQPTRLAHLVEWMGHYNTTTLQHYNTTTLQHYNTHSAHTTRQCAQLTRSLSHVVLEHACVLDRPIRIQFLVCAGVDGAVFAVVQRTPCPSPLSYFGNVSEKVNSCKTKHACVLVKTKFNWAFHGKPMGLETMVVDCVVVGGGGHHWLIGQCWRCWRFQKVSSDHLAKQWSLNTPMLTIVMSVYHSEWVTFTSVMFFCTNWLVLTIEFQRIYAFHNNSIEHRKRMLFPLPIVMLMPMKWKLTS